MAELAPAGKESRERKAEAVELILDMLADGHRRADIMPELAGFDVCDRTVRNWLNEALARHGQETGLLRQSRLGLTVARYDYLWRRAVEGVPTVVKCGNEYEVVDIPDLRLAKTVNDSVATMLGLNEAVEIKHLIPNAWHSMFDEYGIRRPGNGKGNGAGGGNGKDEPPQVRN